MWTSTRSPSLVFPCACGQFLHGDAATTASINVSLSDLCQSEILDFWFCWSKFFLDAQCNSR